MMRHAGKEKVFRRNDPRGRAIVVGPGHSVLTLVQQDEHNLHCVDATDHFDHPGFDHNCFVQGQKSIFGGAPDVAFAPGIVCDLARTKSSQGYVPERKKDAPCRFPRTTIVREFAPFVYADNIQARSPALDLLETAPTATCPGPWAKQADRFRGGFLWI